MQILKATTTDVLIVTPLLGPDVPVALEAGSEVTAIMVSPRTEDHVGGFHINADVGGRIHTGYCGRRSLEGFSVLATVNEGRGSSL